MSELLWVVNPLAVTRHFGRYRYLLWRLAMRDVAARYRGSWLGPLWSLLTPLMMLAVYTFVFSVVFKARWGVSSEGGRGDFALALFAGLTGFNLFAETVSGAPGLVIKYPNFVKRVVFPLEVLPVAQFASNLIQSGLSFVVFLLAVLVLKGMLPWTLLWLPVVLVPLALLSLGAAFFLAGVGVFVRDIHHVIGLLVQVLLFMSAVFYQVSVLPPRWQRVLYVNPLVPILEDLRRISLAGLAPDWPAWAATTAATALLAAAGLVFFMRLKRAFADVV